MQTTSAYMDPYSYSSEVGDHGYPFTPREMLEDCNGDYDYGPYAITSGLSWSSSNSSVATVSGGYVECLSNGTCNINFTYNAIIDYDGDYSCNPAYNNFYDSGSITVKPKISGSNTLWWFYGENPSGYATSTTLTASPASGTSYSWTIVNGTAQVRFPGEVTTLNTGSSNQIVVHTINSSGSQNDIGITVSVNGGTASSQFKMTSLTPWTLAPGAIVDQTVGSGYASFINYTVNDQFGTLLPATVPLNEKFPGYPNDGAYDYSGSNWLSGGHTQAGFNAPSAAFADLLQPASFSGMVPALQTPQNPRGNVKIWHTNQEWYVGSTNIGVGRRVQTNVLQFYQDHGLHLSIVSPNP